MTHILADLLGNNHPLFKFNLAQLERAVGGDVVDARLVVDITERAHVVMRRLGLETENSTAEEVYYALNNTIVSRVRHAKLLAECPYVLLKIGNEVISFNLQDVIENAHHELNFTNRKMDHAQRHLRAEIVKRYAQYDALDSDIVDRIGSEIGIVQPEDKDFGPINEQLAAELSEKKPAARMLMIGDIFTDAFIKLDEEYAVVEKDADGKEWLKLPFGSKPPYERVDIVQSVGPSPNAAVSCSRLGHDVQLMAWLGDDEPGRKSLAHLADEGVDVSTMITQKGSASSYWYVLRHGADRTMLVKSEKYDYRWVAPKETPQWVYLAYIGEDSWPVHEGLLEYLEANPNIQFVFQPATYHFEWGVEKLKGLYKRANLVVMNREEAVQVTGKSYDDLKALAAGLHELGPEKVVITDGSHGSYASHDEKMFTIPNYPDPAPPLDRTGAGDAFASTIVAALAFGETIDTALSWAPINSMNVVQAIGAQAGLLQKADIEKYLKDAPKDYLLKEI